VIKKKKIIDFLDDLGLYIREKTIFTKKKNPSLSRLSSSILFARFLKDREFSEFRDFSYWITDEIGPTGVSFHC
jgi:hypothetical protein